MGAGNTAKYPLLLGVDAGGTKTQAWLAQLHRHRSQTVDAPAPFHRQLKIMGSGSRGPANVRSVGVQQAAVVIAESISDALRDSKLPATEVDVIWIGAAGAATPAVAAELRSILENQLAAKRLLVSGDIELVVAAAQAADGSGGSTRPWTDIPQRSDPDANCSALYALPSRHDTCRDTNILAVIAGTGSVVCGRESTGGLRNAATCIVGGWGPLIGDLGSGLWFGRQVLQAACHAVDGIGPPTALLSRVLEHFQIDEPRALPQVLQQSSTASHTIAGLTPLLKDVVDHDEVARKIVDQGVADLAQQVNVVVQKLNGAVSEWRLALAGSVLTKTDFIATRLLSALEPIWAAQFTNAKSAPAFLSSDSQRGDFIRPKVMRIRHPVYGALVLAAETLVETSTNSMGTSAHCP